MAVVQYSPVFGDEGANPVFQLRSSAVTVEEEREWDMQIGDLKSAQARGQ